MKPAPDESDLISQHGAFVRSLASALTRCEADADDLEQGTWIEVLTRPPRDWTSPRGWLVRVMRRRVVKRRLADERRTFREQQVARKERVDSDLDLSLVLGELASALQILDPDLRRVVIARHFEGLELSELARREGVGLTTLKVRLKRAHGELRVTLDRDGGGRERWMLALLPLSHTPIPAPTSAPAAPAASAPLSASTSLASGVFAVTLLKTSTALIFVGALIFGISQLGERSETKVQSGLVGIQPEAEESVKVVAPERTAERKTIAESGQTEGVSEQQAPVVLATLNVTVTDLFGMAAKGVKVFAAPAGLPMNRMGTTDHDGSFSVQWLPNGALPLVVGLQANGKWLGGLRRFSVTGGSSQEFRLAVHPELLKAQYQSVVTFEVNGETSSLHMANAELISVLVSLDQPQVIKPKPRPRRQGRIHPHPRLDEVTGGALFSAFDEKQNIEARLSFLSGAVLRLDSQSGPVDQGPKGQLSGTVRDDLGQPVAFTRVRAVGNSIMGGEGSIPTPFVEDAYTDIEGEYSMDLVAGEYEVRTETKAAGAPTGKVRVEEGGKAVWHGFVDPGISLVGEIDFLGSTTDDGIQDPQESDLPTLMVEAASAQNGVLWVGVTLSQEDGRFFLPRCAATLLKVQFSQFEDGHLLHSEERVMTGQHDWRIQLDASNRTALTWLPMEDGGVGGPVPAELRIWDADMERGWLQDVGGRMGKPATASLTPGTWFLEMSSAGACTSGLIRVEVLEGQQTDLGPISLGQVGWLEIPKAPPGREWIVVSEQTDRPRFVAYSGQGFATEDGPRNLIAVPPGVYRIQQWISETEGEGGRTMDLGTIELAPRERRTLSAKASDSTDTE
jgi:RNA polymerase sigma factor (sigma-70 family)